MTSDPFIEIVTAIQKAMIGLVVGVVIGFVLIYIYEKLDR